MLFRSPPMRALLRTLFRANPRFARRQYRRARFLSDRDLGRRFASGAYREIFAILRYMYLILPVIFLPFAAWDIYALFHETEPGLMIYFDAVLFPVFLLMLLLLHQRPGPAGAGSLNRVRLLSVLGVFTLSLAATGANLFLLDSVNDLSIFSVGMLAIAIIFRFPDKTKYFIYGVNAALLYGFYFLRGISEPAMIQNPLFVLFLAVLLDRVAYLTLVNNYLKKKRILELNQLLIQEDRNKSDMIGIAIHDLKSPVAGIMSVSRLIKDNPERFGAAEQTEIAADIESSSRKILNKIEKLVSLASSTIDAAELKIESFDVHAFVFAAMEGWNYQASLKKIKVRVRLADDLPRIRSDARAAARILDNLLSNAVKFSPPGGTIFIHAHSVYDAGDSPRIRLLVRDEGPGFTHEDRPRMYSRLTRLSARPTAGESSTGMGLYIVHKLVRILDARIELENPAGGGARFALTLPAG